MVLSPFTEEERARLIDNAPRHYYNSITSPFLPLNTMGG